MSHSSRRQDDAAVQGILWGTALLVRRSETGEGASDMRSLRDHRLMTYRGLSNWPPVWVRSSRGPYTKITGEVGTLTGVKWYDLTANRCFLLMEFQSERYMGSLIFDDAAFCRQILDLLQDHIGESIIDIGDLDISFTF